jgi:hypothetical protein
VNVHETGKRSAGGQELAGEDQLGADGGLVVQVQQHRQVAFLFGRAHRGHCGDFADDVVGDQNSAIACPSPITESGGQAPTPAVSSVAAVQASIPRPLNCGSRPAG